MFILALIVSIGVFVGFLSLVGSPSEVETTIGLVIAAIVFLFILIAGWRSKAKAHENKQNEKIAALERELEALKAKK